MNDGRIRVLVLYGGRSSEHSISCVSAGSILSALDRSRFDPVPVGITRDGAWVGHHGDPERMVIRDGILPDIDSAGDTAALSLDPAQPGVWFETAEGRVLERIDVVFPVLPGPNGEDGTIQGLFEIAGLPYVGSGVLASAACMDKAATKKLLAAASIPAGEWHTFPHSEWGPATAHAEVVAGLGWPVFVKPTRAGSSMGVSKVHGPDQMDRAVAHAGEHDTHVIVEAGVEQAREIECGVLVGVDGIPRASVCAEIRVRSQHEFYDFEAKYLDDSADLIVPAELDEASVDQVRGMALRSFRALGCEGLARVDFFVESDGSVSVNEINTMPGFTSISMYPRMWQASGIGYTDLISTLIGEALSRAGTAIPSRTS